MAVVPVSGGLTERRLMLIQDLRPDVIACTPSYALTLAQAFAERGVAPDRISLRFAVLGAEPWTEEMRREIDAGLGATLTKQALPLIRCWTGDITSLNSEACTCGRALVRMGRIKGRADDTLIIRGVNVYPTQVEAALLQLPELSPNYRIVVSRTGTLDEAEVEVEVAQELVGDSALRSRAERALRETIGCSIAVALQPPGTLPRSEGGKLQRLLDRR
jgi:phenylacetate-CoA ligase